MIDSKLLESVGVNADAEEVLSGNLVVLYANEDALVVLAIEEEGCIRDDIAPAYVIYTYVSDKHSWAVSDALEMENIGNKETVVTSKCLEWKGNKYPYETMEISDVTPINQDDLSNSVFYVAKNPGFYEVFDNFYKSWKDPIGKEIIELMESIYSRDKSEMEKSENLS